jgi:hypothetical protein
LAGVPRCINLDTDLIACSDLNDLQILDLQAKSRACATDGGIASPEQQQRLRCNLKLRDSLHYVKSGVIVMNLDAWRLRQIQVNALNIAQDNQDVLDPMDQDALTIALAGDSLTLDPKLNTSKGKADASFSDGIFISWARSDHGMQMMQEVFKIDGFTIGSNRFRRPASRQATWNSSHRSTASSLDSHPENGAGQPAQTDVFS